MCAMRPAIRQDIEEIFAIDHLAPEDTVRAGFTRQAVAEGRAFVMEEAGQITGFGLLGHPFFGHPFIYLVYIAPDFRGRGRGPQLMDYMAAQCDAAGGRIFTSTNESNARMRHVLIREGWQESGKIDNLDPGDPEVVYVRFTTDTV